MHRWCIKRKRGKTHAVVEVLTNFMSGHNYVMACGTVLWDADFDLVEPEDVLEKDKCKDCIKETKDVTSMQV